MTDALIFEDKTHYSLPDFSFTAQQSYFLTGGFVLLLVATWLFTGERKKAALWFLLIGSTCIFCFAALLDPFLNLWDERFHALVAKNLSEHPLRPAIYSDPVVVMAYDRWDRAIIWLHKQPLFLWQSALSFRLFGISEFTFRLPNIVLGIALIYAIYRTGTLLKSARTGFFAALAAVSTPYMLQLLAGRLMLDQNDFAFVCYISLSIWTFTEYHFSGKKRWLILTGLFSGCAILCKWLVGLLVYAAWLFLRASEKKWKLSQNKDLFVSLVITGLVALPWQLLILKWYPAEAKAEYAFSASHFTEIVEGHGGDFFFYSDGFTGMYGLIVTLLLVPGLILLFRNGNSKKLTASLFAMVGVLYLFFSLAETKMPSFTLPGFLLIVLCVGAALDYLAELAENKLKKRTQVQALLVITIGLFMFVRLDLAAFSEDHSLNSPENGYARTLVRNKLIFKELNLPENTVLFNVKGRHYVEAMFYTGLPAYNFYPSPEILDDLRKKGRKAAVFSKPRDLPEELRDKDIIVINKELKGYE